jgi:hypothetical protein
MSTLCGEYVSLAYGWVNSMTRARWKFLSNPNYMKVASTVINLQEAQHFCVIGIAEKVIVLPHQIYSEIQ